MCFFPLETNFFGGLLLLLLFNQQRASGQQLLCVCALDEMVFLVILNN